MKDLDLNFEELMDVLGVFPITEAVYEAVKDLNHYQFMTVLATVIDQWSARHNLTQKETLRFWKCLQRSRSRYMRS